MEWPATPGLEGVLGQIAAGVRLPRMALVERAGTPARITDLHARVGAEVRRALGGRTADGDPVAVGVGSRGIAGIAQIVAATVTELRRAGFAPFIVPAMGSHGGGTAEGQIKVLAGYGITEAALGVPVRATMDTVVVGDVAGTPVHLDRHVAAAGRAFLVARVKPHTDFHGEIESGAAKMAAIGLGKQSGAQAIHGHGVWGLRHAMPEVGRFIADRYLLGAVAVVEDEFDATLAVRGLIPAEIGRDGERELLDLARRSLPKLPVAGPDAIDVLIVSRMGKDISGTGMDPNVIGRWLVPGLDEQVSARSVVVLDVTPASHGNVIGVGLADFVPRRLVAQIDLPAFYLNVMTSGWAGLRRGRLPMVLPTDRDVITAAVAVCGPRAFESARIVWIEDTLHTHVSAVSEALWPAIDADPALRRADGDFSLPFDGHGQLDSWSGAASGPPAQAEATG